MNEINIESSGKGRAPGSGIDPIDFGTWIDMDIHCFARPNPCSPHWHDSKYRVQRRGSEFRMMFISCCSIGRDETITEGPG